jgi:hypothetical protein
VLEAVDKEGSTALFCRIEMSPCTLRDYIEKHGLSYANAPEFLEAYQEEADRMVQKKRKEIGQE